MSRVLFAWIDPEETTFGPEHERVDEHVFSLDFSQDEGDAAAVALEILNPRVGFLNPMRKVWAWIAYEDDALTVTPLGRFRLVGIPQDIRSEVVLIDMVAMPTNLTEQKAALAADLRVSPYYDPIWLQPDQRLNDDAVLEGYSALWHIDPVTHELSISSIILGEDGTLNLGGNVFEDSVATGIAATPIRSIDCTLNVGWGQDYAGVIDIAPLIKAQFGGKVTTYTGAGLESSWPRPGTPIGGGWEFYRSDPNVTKSSDKVMTPYGEVYLTNLPFFLIQFPLWEFDPVCEVAYTADRVRRETIRFTVALDVQAVLTDDGEDEPVLFELGSEDVDQPIDPPDSDHPEGTIPIVDPQSNIFLTKDRGIAAVENGMMLARAKLLKAARAVEVKAETTFETGLAFSLRKSLSFLDPRLPGGGASGKITAYRLTIDGDSGERNAAFTLGCCVGTGASLVLEDGEGVYAEDDYAEDGWQVVLGQEVLLAGLDLAYTAFDNVSADAGGIDFSNINAAAFATVEVENLALAQSSIIGNAALLGGLISIGQTAEMLRAVSTRISVTMRPITGDDLTAQYETTLTPLVCPNGIDLEAS